jgi:hypothetical protein
MRNECGSYKSVLKGALWVGARLEGMLEIEIEIRGGGDSQHGAHGWRNKYVVRGMRTSVRIGQKVLTRPER